MSKFYGEVGYAVSEKTKPGVTTEDILERVYYGDIVRNIRRLEYQDEINPDISLNNSVSIVADAYAYEHFFAIRYVNWSGALWIVSEVDVQRPRLILQLGGIYNGVRGSAAPVPDGA